MNMQHQFSLSNMILSLIQIYITSYSFIEEQKKKRIFYSILILASLTGPVVWVLAPSSCLFLPIISIGQGDT